MSDSGAGTPKRKAASPLRAIFNFDFRKLGGERLVGVSYFAHVAGAFVGALVIVVGAVIRYRQQMEMAELAGMRLGIALVEAKQLAAAHTQAAWESLGAAVGAVLGLVFALVMVRLVHEVALAMIRTADAVERGRAL